MSFNLRVKLQPLSSSSKTRHGSLHNDRVASKHSDDKKKELEQAVQFCKQNNCKGYKALQSLDLVRIKDPRTIYKHLAGTIVTGEEKEYAKILTATEETSLVKYLINRNRACQGLSESEVKGVVLNILRTRKQLNARGGRKFAKLSENAKTCLAKKSVGRSFFRRLRARHPQLKKKIKRKVSVNRGLRCTRDMAVQYLDELAELLIEDGIAPDLEKIEPGVWEGAVDTSRIWAHDETPQFINYSQTGGSKQLIYAGSGHDCNRVTKENRECITIQPFSNFSGDLAMCQVLFSGTGLTSHMCPETATDNIENLFISVTEKGVSTQESLYAAYVNLESVILERGCEKPQVIIADGHKSRFGEKVLSFCENKHLDQFILPPDTSGVTQKHDQINQKLHSAYEAKKDEIFSDYAVINKEGFMTILAEVWNKWASPQCIVKAGKRVGISKEGLNVNWMDQDKFEQAEAILNPPTPSKNLGSPKNLRKGSAAYSKAKYNQRTDQNQSLSNSEVDLEEVPGLMPYKTIKPKMTTIKRIMDVHGSMKASDVRLLIQEKNEVEKKKVEKKEATHLQKEETKKLFLSCVTKCSCLEKVCKALSLQQCSVCGNVQKSQCNKKVCKVDGELPSMICVAAKKGKKEKRKRKWYDNVEEFSEEEEVSEEEEEYVVEETELSEREVSDQEKEEVEEELDDAADAGGSGSSSNWLNFTPP